MKNVALVYEPVEQLIQPNYIKVGAKRQRESLRFKELPAKLYGDQSRFKQVLSGIVKLTLSLN